MTRVLCVCGCGINAVARHHVIYRQHLMRAPGLSAAERRKLVRDPRNLVDVSLGCHAAHHARTRPLTHACLPDSVYAFASWVLGPGPAYEFLFRRYTGEDPRLDALLAAWEAAA